MEFDVARTGAIKLVLMHYSSFYWSWSCLIMSDFCRMISQRIRDHGITLPIISIAEIYRNA